MSTLRDLSTGQILRELLTEGWEPAEVADALARALGRERLRRDLQQIAVEPEDPYVSLLVRCEIDLVRAIVDAGTHPENPAASPPGSSLAAVEGATASALSDVAARLDSEGAA